MSFRPSLRLEQLGSHWADFNEIWYLFFFKSVDTIQVSLQCDKTSAVHEV